MLPGGIDGSLTPQLIPDSVAYRLFFSAVAEPITPSATQIARQQAKLSRASLTAPDLAQLVLALASYQAQSKFLDDQYRTLPLVGASQELELQHDALVSTTITQLKKLLSRDGIIRLDGLIQSEKHNMTIFPFPKM